MIGSEQIHMFSIAFEFFAPFYRAAYAATPHCTQQHTATPLPWSTFPLQMSAA